jgi:putative transposase
MELPKRWTMLVDGIDEAPAETIETCIHRGRPFGDEKWVIKTAAAMALISSLRPQGRPKKEGTI